MRHAKAIRCQECSRWCELGFLARMTKIKVSEFWSQFWKGIETRLIPVEQQILGEDNVLVQVEPATTILLV